MVGLYLTFSIYQRNWGLRVSGRVLLDYLDNAVERGIPGLSVLHNLLTTTLKYIAVFYRKCIFCYTYSQMEHRWRSCNDIISPAFVNSAPIWAPFNALDPA